MSPPTPKPIRDLVPIRESRHCSFSFFPMTPEQLKAFHQLPPSAATSPQLSPYSETHGASLASIGANYLIQPTPTMGCGESLAMEIWAATWWCLPTQKTNSRSSLMFPAQCNDKHVYRTRSSTCPGMHKLQTTQRIARSATRYLPRQACAVRTFDFEPHSADRQPRASACNLH